MQINEIIEFASKEFNLNPDTIACIICQESQGNPWAFRVEWKRILNRMTITMGKHVPKSLPTKITERVSRSCSFGYMQILGDTARDFGYKADYLTSLFEPSLNIKLGCKIFRTYLDSRGGDERLGLLRYNGGGDPKYPDKVYKWKNSGLFNLVRYGHNLVKQ